MDNVLYDPILSTMEQNVIDAFDYECLSVLTKMADGQWIVNIPTLFYMPHCELFLADSVLEPNWTPGNLKKIITQNTVSQIFVSVIKSKSFCDSDHMLREIPLPQTTISLDNARHSSIDGDHFMISVRVSLTGMIRYTNSKRRTQICSQQIM